MAKTTEFKVDPKRLLETAKQTKKGQKRVKSLDGFEKLRSGVFPK